MSLESIPGKCIRGMSGVSSANIPCNGAPPSLRQNVLKKLQFQEKTGPERSSESINQLSRPFSCPSRGSLFPMCLPHP